MPFTTTLCREQIMCPICQDVFVIPVTLPCGHNYCKACITQHFESNDLMKCPLCDKLFHRRPELVANTILSEMAGQFRGEVTVKQHPRAGSAHVSCDYCSDKEAVTSCLTCMASFCETHLEPHQRLPLLKKHQLIEPVENLGDRLCQKHARPLEKFCQNEQVCVCQFCTETDHKLHQVVSLKEGYDGKMAQLGQMQNEIQQRIQERQRKIQEMQQSIQLSKDYANTEIEAGKKVFVALKRSIKNSETAFISAVQNKQKSTEQQAEGFIGKMEQEITQLTKRSSELEKLLQTEDHIHLLQNLPSLSTPPHAEDWTEVQVNQPSYVGTLRSALDQLEEKLCVEMKSACDADLKKIQQEAVDVTLDPETAHPRLVLSEDGKQVYADIQKYLPDSPSRFSLCMYVLGKQSFSSGRFYYEVEVKRKTDWDVGVAKKSIDRKKIIVRESGFWSVRLMNGNKYNVGADPAICHCVRTEPQKVGVFVDYEEGLVSFYDVENKINIYSFTGCCFTDPLCPCFSPCDSLEGKNDAPLVITPVNTSE